MLGNAQKMPETSLQWGILAFAWRGGIRDWLLYVWNYGATQVDAGTPRHHEQYARACRAAGKPDASERSAGRLWLLALW